MAEINKRRRPVAAILGLFILIFTIIGFVSTIIGAVNLTKRLLDNTSQKNEFERIIYPALMLDPVPFENVEAADEMFLLESSMWAVILNEQTEKYDVNEIGFTLIPSIDLDVWCKRMFGDTVTLNHQTMEGEGFLFYYDETEKVYQVPDGSEIVHYTPSVEEISKKGDIYTLKVGYLSPSAITTTIFTGEEPEPDKMMYYILTKTDGKYVITSIKSASDDDYGDVSWEPVVSFDVTSSEEVSSVEEASSEEISSEVTSDTSSEATSTEETSSETTSSGQDVTE